MRLLRIWGWFLLSGCLAACEQDFAPPLEAPVSDEGPFRVVSLDFCADQYVLKLLDREQILAVSPDATKQFSYMRDEAVGLPVVRPIAEDVLVLQPDLVVRSYGGGPNATAFFEDVGIPVLNIGWASNIDGEDFGSITGGIQHVADGLGESERGAALVRELRERMEGLSTDQTGREAFYMTPGGATTGPGSLVHEMMMTAGLSNFQKREGWNVLPLERLAYDQPDLVVAAFFESSASLKHAWSATRHPVARRELRDRPVITIEGAWTSCGSWFIMDAVEALARGAQP